MLYPAELRARLMVPLCCQPIGRQVESRWLGQGLRMNVADEFSPEVRMEHGFKTLLRQGGFLRVRSKEVDGKISEGGQVLRRALVANRARIFPEDDIECQ